MDFKWKRIINIYIYGVICINTDLGGFPQSFYSHKAQLRWYFVLLSNCRLNPRSSSHQARTVSSELIVSYRLKSVNSRVELRMRLAALHSSICERESVSPSSMWPSEWRMAWKTSVTIFKKQYFYLGRLCMECMKCVCLSFSSPVYVAASPSSSSSRWSCRWAINRRPHAGLNRQNLRIWSPAFPSRLSSGHRVGILDQSPRETNGWKSFRYVGFNVNGNKTWYRCSWKGQNKQSFFFSQ